MYQVIAARNCNLRVIPEPQSYGFGIVRLQNKCQSAEEMNSLLDHVTVNEVWTRGLLTGSESLFDMSPSNATFVVSTMNALSKYGFEKALFAKTSATCTGSAMNVSGSFTFLDVTPAGGVVG